MALTRSAIEQVLVLRTGKRMAFVGMSIVPNGSNADLSDPISTALMSMGISPANIASPADADLVAVESTADLAKFIDLAELRLLENIFGNCDKVTLQAASGTEHFGQFTQDLEKAIQRKSSANQRNYGVGIGETVVGTRKLA